MKKYVGNRRVLGSWALAGLLCLTTAVHAQSYPNKAVRLIDNYPPGGSTDVVARVLAQEMSSTFGQPFVVENRPGAAGNIGTDYVAKAKPDGYVLGIAPNTTVSVNPVLYSKLPFDVRKDLTGVGMLARVPMVLVVSEHSKLANIDDVVAAGRAGGTLTYASAGSGTPHHLAAEIFQSLTNTRLTHVPYKGSAPALVDLLSGQVNIMFNPINSALPFIQSGKLKALGVTSAKRLASLPNVPTVAEKIPNFSIGDIWIGLVVPAQTPRAVIEQLNAETKRIIALPRVRESLARQGIEAESSSVEDFNRLMDAERGHWADVIKRANIKVD